MPSHLQHVRNKRGRARLRLFGAAGPGGFALRVSLGLRARHRGLGLRRGLGLGLRVRHVGVRSFRRRRDDGMNAAARCWGSCAVANLRSFEAVFSRFKTSTIFFNSLSLPRAPSLQKNNRKNH
jgi:hypothetical protein